MSRTPAVNGPFTWQSLVPGLVTLRHYERGWLRGDLLAGVTVAAYLIPQVMAYAAVAGLPAVVGLWATVGPLLVYVVFGSSRQLSVGPESTTALMTALAVGTMLAAAGQTGDVQRHAELAAVLAVATGVVCLVAWLLRLGFLASLLSRPVLVGYLAGVGVLMILSQLDKVTGLSIEGDQVWTQLAWLFGHLDQVNPATATLAAGVVVALFLFARWAPKWPGPLIVMLAAAGVVQLAGLQRYGVQVVGDIPAGLPPLTVPDFSGLDWAVLVPAAASIAIVGYSDNALTGRAFAARRRERIDTNQELLALGLANIAAGLTRGFPVSSSGSRTVLGAAMGSNTQLYSLVTLLTVVISMFTLGPLLAAFPEAALGGVVIFAAVRLVDMDALRRLARFRTTELLLALVTTVSVVLFGVLIGIGVAVGLSVLDVLHRIAAPHAAVLGYVPGLAGMHDVDDYPEVTEVPGLVMFRYDSALFFANAENFRRRALAVVDAADGQVRWFILNCEAITVLDLTAIDALQELHDELASRGISLGLARLKQETLDELDRAGFVDQLDGRVYPTLPTAVTAYVDWVTESTGSRPEWADALPLPPVPPGRQSPAD